MTTIDETQDQLIAAGWSQLPSGRWTHSAFPGAAGRRRVFTKLQAASLLEASPKDPAVVEVPA